MSAEIPFDPTQSRIDAMMDGSGMSYHEARTRLGLDDEESAHVTRPRKPRKPRPTGKAVEGLHGVQESNRLAAEDALANPMDPQERRAAAARGRAAIRQAMTGQDTLF